MHIEWLKYMHHFVLFKLSIFKFFCCRLNHHGLKLEWGSVGAELS